MPTFTPPYKLFNPTWSTSHNAKDALALALASQLAYETSKNKAKSKMNSWGFASTATVNVNKGGDIDTNAIIGGNDRTVLVAFRGSASKANWLANFQTMTDPGPLTKTKVHEGFQDSLFPALLGIARKVHEFRNDGQDIWLTGHSYGGALAVLLAAMLLEQGVKCAGLYTFGAPRVGNHRFQRELDSKLLASPHYRYVNQNDIVPQVPPEPFFTHAGERRIIQPEKGKVTKSANVWVNIKKSFIDWYDTITEADIVIKDAHLLASTIGYLPTLLKAAGHEKNGSIWT